MSNRRIQIPRPDQMIAIIKFNGVNIRRHTGEVPFSFGQQKQHFLLDLRKHEFTKPNQNNVLKVSA